jgi:hypothetical protein
MNNLDTRPRPANSGILKLINFIDKKCPTHDRRQDASKSNRFHACHALRRLRTSATSQIIGNRWISVENALRAGLPSGRNRQADAGHSAACRSHEFLDPVNSAVRHCSILELPSLNAPARWFGESARGSGCICLMWLRRRDDFEAADKDTHDLSRCWINSERQDVVDEAARYDVDQATALFEPGVFPGLNHGVGFVSI